MSLRNGIQLRGQRLGEPPTARNASSPGPGPGSASVSTGSNGNNGGNGGNAPADWQLPSDPAFRADLEKSVRAYHAHIPLLISGETGAGKEVAARTIHAHGASRNAPFVAMNCGNLAPELIASELFGHVEGAFTGAVRGGSIGKIEAANGGTVLLDEMGDMPLSVQVALLRVLDSGEVLPVGGIQARHVQVRFICATHKNLQAMVQRGTFREDLYFRLRGYHLRIPPLRERSDFRAVIDQLCARLHCPPEHLDDGVRDYLARQPWPGNIRQLQHALALAIALQTVPGALTIADFAEQLEEAGSGNGAAGVPVQEPSTTNLKMQAAHAIDQALQRHHGNVDDAARALGISRSTLYRKLKRSTAN